MAAMAAQQSARELARLGRVEQLKALADFERGRDVTFKLHNNPKGFPLNKNKVKPVPRTETRVKFTPWDRLVEATVGGNFEEVERLIKAGVNVNSRDADGMTALHRACVENHLNIASLLAQNGADVNAQDNDWWTPLHAAASAGNWRVANFLMAQGSKPTAINAEGDLPIDLVSDPKVEKIIQREMELLELDEAKIEALRSSNASRMLADMQELVRSGGDLNRRLEHGATYLHVAACNGFTPVVVYLLAQPSTDPNVADEEGNTPLHLAAFFQHYEVVMHLASGGADLSVRNRLQEKPIVITEDETMIRLLSALDKKIKASLLVPASGPRRYAGSISRGGREKMRASVKKDLTAECKELGNQSLSTAD